MTNGPGLVWRAIGVLLVAFMLTPLVLLALFAFSDKSLLSFPITGLTLRWFVKLNDTAKFWTALGNSLTITSVVGVISTLIGTMAATALARLPSRVAGMTMVAMTLPVMLPPLVLAIALANYYATLGIKFGLATVIVGHLVFTQPIVILIVYARMAAFDYAVVNSARDLGASPLRAFLTVTLPIVRPTIIGAALVAMALSIDDFVITFFTFGGGNTLPIYMMGLMRRGVNPQINVASLVLITMTIGASLIALRATRYRG